MYYWDIFYRYLIIHTIHQAIDNICLFSLYFFKKINNIVGYLITNIFNIA